MKTYFTDAFDAGIASCPATMWTSTARLTFPLDLKPMHPAAECGCLGHGWIKK
jgi:hypothetical protein